MGAPPTEDFDEAREAAAIGAPNPMSRQRLNLLQWCVTEAIRTEDRDALRQADVISLQLDERHGRLLIKYLACNQNLVMKVGVLALLHNVGKTALEIDAGVHEAIRPICVRRSLSLPGVPS